MALPATYRFAKPHYFTFCITWRSGNLAITYITRLFTIRFYYDLFTFFCHSSRRIFSKYLYPVQIVDATLAIPICVHTFFFISALQLPIFMLIETYSDFTSTFFLLPLCTRLDTQHSIGTCLRDWSLAAIFNMEVYRNNGNYRIQIYATNVLGFESVYSFVFLFGPLFMRQSNSRIWSIT